MAELHVQRKRKNYWWLWLLIILVIIAAVFYYINYYRKGNTAVSNSVISSIGIDTARTDTANYNQQNNTTADRTSAARANISFWDQVDFNIPDTTYAEVRDKNVIEKANDRYAIYSIKNDILFDSNKTYLSAVGKTGLKQVAASINQRFNDADVRIYSHTDSSNQIGTNAQLMEQRAEAVRSFIVNDGKVNENRISISPIGSSSTASAASGGGNKKGGTIDIVVKR